MVLDFSSTTIFIGRTEAEVEAPILWPPDAKRRLIEKDPDAGKDWGQKEKEEAEDEMTGENYKEGYLWLEVETWFLKLYQVQDSS